MTNGSVASSTPQDKLPVRNTNTRQWFSGGRFISPPDELYQGLVEDCTFDLFFQTYGARFTKEQLQSAEALKAELERYYDSMPKRPVPQQVLDDPEWHRVRKTAERFVQALGG
jgi:hypothetical protein